jgi:hypothetical protein
MAIAQGSDTFGRMLPSGLRYMGIMKKRPFLVILMVFLILGVLYVAMCSHLCPSGTHATRFLQHLNCTVQSHSFTYNGTGLSVLFVLPLIGLFFLMNITFFPQELILSPFKPPQFQS